MTSASRFWPSRLFGKSGKGEPSPAFIPMTELAARIVGKPVAGTSGFETPIEIDRIADELEAPEVLDAAQTDGDTSRQAERFVPERPFTTLTDKRGKVIRGRIINLSSSGVAIEADFRIMSPDNVAMAGSKPVIPGRPIRGGHVFVFSKPLDPARCNKQVVL